MSSYYTTAQLEAMRKEKLRAELNETVTELREKLRSGHTSEVHMAQTSGTELSVFAEDEIVGGCDSASAVTAETLEAASEGASEREELDFSGLLTSPRKKPSALERELDSWIKKADERPVLTEKDAADRTRLLSELAAVVNSTEMDIEEKLWLVRTRVTSYLQGGEQLTAEDAAQIETEYYHYCALCELLGVAPKEKHPYRVKKEIERMTAVLEKRREAEYVMEVIEDIMEELGCRVKADAVLDHTVGQVYAVDGHPLCDVFVGNDGSGIMFEPIAESREGSADEQRRVESSANSVCSLYSVLEERAAERGVILRRVYAEPANIGSMCVRADVSETAERGEKRKRKTAAPKQRAMDPEG